jgi:FAD/FMN-containing dehydrogenase
MVLASGELLEVNQNQPELLRKVRYSYGTFGIITQATFRIRPIQPMAVHHETFALEEFVQKLPPPVINDRQRNPWLWSR